MLNKKNFLRILCALLAILCVLSLASCDLAAFLPEDLFGDGGNSGDGGDSFDGGSEDVVKSDFENTYRDQLNENELSVYDAVAAAEAGESVFHIALAEPIVLCSGREPNEKEKDDASERVSYWVTNALYAVWLDCPYLFWLETGNYTYSYSMVPDKSGTYRIKDIKVEVEERANAASASVYKTNIDNQLSTLALSKATDYDTVVAINDYLCSLITYDLDAPNRQNVYGALREKKCVCEGYAHAFKLLCDKFGIDCVSIVGTGYSDGESEAHMWNAVRLDGMWYAVDVTWNDQASKNTKNGFLLVGRNTEIFGETFAESHVTEYTRGTSKVFASPAISATAYKK